MLSVAQSIIDATTSSSRSPTAIFRVAWDRSNVTKTWFRLDESELDSSAVLTLTTYTEGNDPTEIIANSSNYRWNDETTNVISAEGLQELWGDDYQAMLSEVDLVLDNSSDKYTPGTDWNILDNPSFESSYDDWSIASGTYGKWTTVGGTVSGAMLGPGGIGTGAANTVSGEVAMKVSNPNPECVGTGVYLYSDYYGASAGIATGTRYIGSFWARGQDQLLVSLIASGTGTHSGFYLTPDSAGSYHSSLVSGYFNRYSINSGLGDTDTSIALKASCTAGDIIIDCATLEQATELFRDDFYSYADTTALDVVYDKNANTTWELNKGATNSVGITGGTELIRNGSFEEGLLEWNKFEGQSAALGDGNITWNVVAGAKDGSYCLRISNTATNSHANPNDQYIVVSPNTTYYYSYWVKLSGGNGVNGMYINLYEYNSAWANTGSTNTTLQNADTDWVEITGSITTAATSAYMIVRLYPSRTTVGNTALCYYDKIRLSTSATDYDVKGGIQKTTGDYSDFTYQTKLQNIWTTSQYNACDATTNWTGYRSAALSIDTDDKKEGTGSLVFNKNSGAASNCGAYYSLVDQDLSANDYFSFWFKTPETADLAKITYIAIFFTSTGDSKSWKWYFDKARCFPTGETWYHIVADKNKFSDRTGALDWTDIDRMYFRVCTSAAADLLGDMKIDDISFQNIRGLEQGIYFRATDEDNCYRFITKDQNTVALQKLVSGIVTDMDTTTFDTTTSQEYNFMVDTQGSSIRGYISAPTDVTRVCVAAIDDTYTTGKIGVMNNVTHTHNDEIIIDDDPKAYEDYIGDYILPRRPVDLDIKMLDKPEDSGGVGGTIPNFVGLTENIEPNLRNDYIRMHCYDFGRELKDKAAVTATSTGPSMYVNVPTNVLIGELAGIAGLSSGTDYISDSSKNIVPFAWFRDGSIWYYMSNLAEAEGGRVFFDEEGVLHFWNRDHIDDNNTSQYTFTLKNEVTNVRYRIDKDEVKNHIVVKANPRALKDKQSMWKTPSAEEIEAGETKTVWANMEDPFTSATEPTAWKETMGTGGTGDSYYKANTESDGTGEDRSALIVLTTWYAFAQDAKMIFRNDSDSKVYLTVEIYGTPAVPIYEGGIEVEERDEDSITIYGQQTLQIENDWILNESYAQNLAKDKLYNLKDPLTQLHIEAVGIPYLQIGDMITVPEGWGTETQKLFIKRNRWQLLEGGDFVQTLDLESKTIAEWFKLDVDILDGDRVLQE